MSDPQPVKPSRRWLGIGLFGSLVLNLFLGGVLVAMLAFGRAPHGRGPGEGPPAPLVSYFREIAGQLPAEKRREVRRILRESFQEARPRMRELGEARKQVAYAIAAEPFDPQKLEAIFAQSNAVFGELAESSQEALLKALALLSPEERQAFAAAVREGKRPPGPRHRDGKDGPPPHRDAGDGPRPHP